MFAHGVIARLHLRPECAPPWFRPQIPCHIPLPHCPAAGPGEPLAWAEVQGRRLTLASAHGGAVHLHLDWATWREYILAEHYRSLSRPLFTRLPLHYHRIPGRLRRAAAALLLARGGPQALPRRVFPAFPIEQGLEALVHAARLEPPPAPPRPLPRIILTHDIDTAAGFDHVPAMAEAEQRHGFRSLWNVVACAGPLRHDLLQALHDRGFEIGLHGYNHDNKLIFLSERAMRARLDACRPLIERYRIRSFRSPSWLRSPVLYRVLKDYVSFDYSALDTDICCSAGVGGCLWTRPFQRHGLTHVPATIPFELPLLFGYTPGQLLDFWRPKLDWLDACGGHVVVNTHPDPHYSGNPAMIEAYSELLTDLAARRERCAQAGLPPAAAITPAFASA